MDIHHPLESTACGHNRTFTKNRNTKIKLINPGPRNPESMKSVHQQWVQQESPADARVMRDSSAYMNAPEKKSKLSWKSHPRTKNHVDWQTGCELMAIFVYPRWPSAAIS